MGLFSEISGIFGAVQEKRAAAEASRILNQAKQQAMNESAKLSEQFDPFVSNAMTGYAETGDMLKRYLANVEGLQVDQGLTAADRIAYQDAAKLLNENLVSTGNLRSGAAAFGQAELLRRVVADAETRRFNQEIARFGLLSGGIGQFGQLAGEQGQLGLGGKQLSTNLLQTAFNMAPAIAGAELQKGAANANLLQSIGGLTDTVVNTTAGAFAGFGGMIPGVAGAAAGKGFSGAGMGALLGSGGGGGLTQYMLLSKMFAGSGAGATK